MIISLGSSCQVSGNIKKFVNSFGKTNFFDYLITDFNTCLLYTSPSPRDRTRSRMPSSA